MIVSSFLPITHRYRKYDISVHGFLDFFLARKKRSDAVHVLAFNVFHSQGPVETKYPFIQFLLLLLLLALSSWNCELMFFTACAVEMVEAPHHVCLGGDCDGYFASP